MRGRLAAKDCLGQPGTTRGKGAHPSFGANSDLPLRSCRICLFGARLAMSQHLTEGGRDEEEEGVSRVIRRGKRCPRWAVSEWCYPARHTPGRAANSPACLSCPCLIAPLASWRPYPVHPLYFRGEISFFPTAFFPEVVLQSQPKSAYQTVFSGLVCLVVGLFVCVFYLSGCHLSVYLSLLMSLHSYSHIQDLVKSDQ